MEKKNILFKNIFYIFFAFCFFSIGVMTLNTQNENYVKAEASSITTIDKDAYPYFSAKEYLGTKENTSAIADTFLYFSEGETSSSFKLSLLTNKDDETVAHDIYKWVYYPDENDKSVFYYYYINSVGLSINGVNQNIAMSNFVEDSKLSFPQEDSIHLQSFDMILTDKTTDLDSNEISIKDEQGKVKEGIYQLSLTYTLFTCTDGKADMSEQNIVPSPGKINYEFYVLEKDNYLSVDSANVSWNNFDHSVKTSTKFAGYSDLLYSNYSSDGNSDGNTDAMPYIEFDYTRYELEITNGIKSTSLSYDESLKTVAELEEGGLIDKIYVDEATHTCKVYFINTDEYDVTFKPIKIVEYQTDETAPFETRKYSLTNLATNTKKVKVYVYGYQANYTDYDKPLDGNLMNQTSELKDYNVETGKFINGADITSNFLNSSSDYSQAKGSESFLIENIVNFLTTAGGNSSFLEPVKTNQSPIDLTSNANLYSKSYVYSTTKVSDAYTKVNGITLNGETLYQATFKGLTDSSEGKYIYIISYTYDNYYENEATLNKNQVFYQAFYFEIIKTVQKNIKVQTIDGENIPTDTYTNKNVTIIDSNSDYPYTYNKDVRIQVYVQDYADNFKSEFGGSYGIEYDGRNFTENGKYTIRLFYENEIANSTEKLAYDYKNLKGEKAYFNTRTFIIDKEEISNVTARNVTEILSTTDVASYKIGTTLETFTTNQSIVLSWDTKASNANTYAYYRWFPLVDAQYYSTNSDTLTKTITRMLSSVNENLPVNALLNLDTNTYDWDSYEGNTLDFTNTVSKEYVLDDPGLYLVDIYDEAGNHKIEVYLIDNTTPIFAIEDTSSGIYSLTDSSMYVTKNSNLCWAKNKAIYIANFDSFWYNGFANVEDVSESKLIKSTSTNEDGEQINTYYDIYTTYNNTPSLEIFQKLYNTLYKNQYMQVLSCNVSTDSTVDSRIQKNGYTENYLTIPVDATSVYMIRGMSSETPSYQKQTGSYWYKILVDKEFTYSIYLRDLSNTVKDLTSASDSIIQYTNYSSSSQTIRVSHDSSKFAIQYTPKGSSTPVDLFANSIVEGTTDDGHKTQVSYLSPTSLNTTFSISYKPTIKDNITIQVESVQIKYYEYEQVTKKVGSTYYTFYRLSDSATVETIYQFPTNDESEDTLTYEIRPITNATRAGKYEITRTYYLGTNDDDYDYNRETDYFERTYVFYVDRNDVISPSSRVTDGNGTHHESLVGGDIFVAMYDNKTSADLVVTFPNSEEGNTDGSNLNNSSNQNPVFTTNMLPVNVYVPQYKYTTYVQKILEGSKYDFKVNFDYYYTTSDTTYLYDSSNCSTNDPSSLETLEKDVCLNVVEIYENANVKVRLDNGTYKYVSSSQYAVLKNQNYYDSGSLIAEYALFAEIYKDGTDASNMVAKTSKNYSDPQIQYLEANNGFLKFYDSNNNPINYLTDAGTYYVKIYQGRFGIEKGNANDYEQALTFCFEIKATEPDFEAQTTQNSPLYYEEGSKTYYTNQPNIKLVWQPGSTFMADIDIDQIKFETPSGNYVYGKDKDTIKMFIGEPTLSNGLWTATLDLEALKVYKNNSWVKVTMQYKNHNDDFYKTVTKTIQVDLSAPNTNINNLIAKSVGSNLIPTLTEKNLRTYYTAKEGEIATSPDTTCFNISSSTGNFKYYSYLVTGDFINTLKTSEDMIYIKKFESDTKYNNNYTQETSPSDFLASNYYEISMFSGFEAGNYYEIVESDKAGNLTIYTVYITSYDNADEKLLTLKNADGDTREYTGADYQKAISYQGSTHTLYALTGYELESINYFGDAWAQFVITTRNSSTSLPITTTLMLSPWDNERAYAYDNNGVATAIYLRDLINASKNVVFKDVISIYDRNLETSTAFYVNIQSTQFTSTLTSQQNAEYITFNMPSNAQIQSTSYATTYLTELKITAKRETGDVVLFDKTGDNANTLGYADIWQSFATEDVIVDYMPTVSQITFALNPALNLAASTKITYEYKDNFGRSYKKIHLYNEPVILTEIMSENELYSYYTDNGKLFYITQDGFKYLYNPAKVEVKVFELDESVQTEEGLAVSKTVGDGVTTSQKATFENIPDNSTKISIYTVRFNANQQQANGTVKVLNYNDSYVLKVYDLETGKEISKIYFKLYNEITQSSEIYADGTRHDAYAGDFKLLDANGNDITSKIITPADKENLGYFSEVRLIYNTTDTFIPVKFSVSKDLKVWEEVNSGTRFKCQTDDMEKYYLKIWYDETYLENEMGTPEYVFADVPAESQIFEFNLSSLTATYWVEKTVNGVTEIVKKDSSMFVAQDGTQYSNHYIVNIDYANKDAVVIKTNEELGIRAFENPGEPYSYGANVKSKVYTITNTKDANGNYNSNLGNIPAFETVIVITYIPSSENFVDEFFTYNMNGVIDKTENLIGLTSKSVVISEDFTSLNTIQLQWSKYYGFSQNEINIKLVKDGVEITPITYSKQEDGKYYNYIQLSHSGKYQVYLQDKAGNVQKFNYGMVGQSDYLNFIFLKDVPFTVTYTNPETGIEETSNPIKQAVYNGTVTLNIDKNTRSEFYSLEGYPVISVKRNGVEYTAFETKDDVKFIFTQTGFYQVMFEATSNIPNVGKIRQESYEFTILDADEYRYSYIFNNYSSYYVEKVVKDGKDITEKLVKSLDVETVTINDGAQSVTYIKELPLSYLDEKTGAGTYMITINTNDRFHQNSDFITKWTYQVKIKVGSAPLKISLAEGEETTGSINFTFNQANVYAEMGNCYVRVVYYVDDTAMIYTNGTEVYNFEINAESTGQLSKDINKTGTYYIQIVSPGNNLLYSYKVVRNEPMNAATIIAIVISAVVAVLVGFIIFKLRKRISVK